jgi:hypothetical protein
MVEECDGAEGVDQDAHVEAAQCRAGECLEQIIAGRARLEDIDFEPDGLGSGLDG